MKTDTAPNATMLGSKPPEYYLAPLNLLHNGDFLNPVNSRGVKANTTHWEYVLDCWHCESANYTPNTVLISNGGVTLAPTADCYCGIQQNFERYSELAGKVCTAAVCTNDTWYVATFPVGSTSAGGILLGNGLLLYSLSTNHFLIRNMAGNSAVTIQRVALYEGTYTADTIPPYVPTHPRVESLKIGNPVQPYNLLDNGDFSNPVNQRGQSSYSGSGYTIDRWRTWDATDVVSINDGYLYHAGAMYQYLTNIDNNKTYTLAVKNTDNTIYTVSGKPVDYPYKDGLNIQPSSNSSQAYVRIWGEEQIKNLVWAALYEGEYTAETLPPYVPKGYAVEALNCGVPVHPRNLLDNSDFANPVNQRGQTTYTNSYGIDRWRTWDGHTITINNGYISVVGSLFQYIELSKVKNTNYTLAVCRTDGNIVCLTYNPKNDYIWNAGIGMGSDGTGVVIISIDTGDYLWAALYEGSYTADNLPPYVPKQYTVELAECQRYYRRIEHTSNMVLFPAIAYNTKSLYGTLPFGFRVKPTIRVSNVVFCKTGITTAKAVVSIASTATSGGITPIMLTANDGDATTGDTYNIWTSTNGGYMELSADL